MAATYGFRVAIAGLLVGTLTSTAHAYLDAGTGSLILQVLLGGFAGLALAGKLYWQKFVSLFGGKRSEDTSRSVADETQSPADARQR
jgi:hypothetical protein